MNPYASFTGGGDPQQIIAGTPARLQELFTSLGPERANVPPSEGKWNAREILCHLADTEIVFAFRLRQSISDEHHIIQPFDQDRWAFSYAPYSTEAALTTFSTVRQWNIAFIHSIPPADFSKLLTHPERGTMSFGVLVETMAGHDINHLRQIEAIAAR
ncbi:DinB family protein [Paludibaculum fermentans]|uniref:DinB family protein n=1 Tax=Paludibaculum fermentans TaxID=1473598 RepID=UPI003EBF152C